MAGFKGIKEVLEKIKLDSCEEKELYQATEEFIKKIKERIASEKLKADVFLGGSVAKRTIIKKNEYDVDIFVRFDKKTKEDEINKLIEKLKVVGELHADLVKGSRNYLRFKTKGKTVFEVVPIIKIKDPKEARNVTDLSVFHVEYIENCVKKNKKLADEIKLAKAFAYGSGYYGAESYINGFSGYALELLVCYYKSFMNFVKKMAKIKGKEVIDPKKHYKNKKAVLTNLNEAKLSSPIILIDPTFKERNALAALSSETFMKFQEYCRKFISKPDEKFFKKKVVDEFKLKELAKKKGFDFVKFKVFTNKQQGDIAGSKLLKFFRYFTSKLKRYFDVMAEEFEYSGKDFATYFFVLKKKTELLIIGPPIDKKENAEKFRQEHKQSYVENNRLYAKEAITFNLSQFFTSFQTENKKLMLDMGIVKIEQISLL